MKHVQDSDQVLKSTAHEDSDVPGTVYLQPVQSAATAYGQAVYPVPSSDPNDPLLWPQWRKICVLLIVCFYSVIGNGTGLALSVYIGTFAEYFKVSGEKSSNIASYGILAYGVSNLFWVPLSIKFGRRFTWLLSLLFYLVFMIAASQAKTYEQLLVCHILGCFACGICESVAVMVIDDIFFLHERGGKVGYYTVSLCLGAVAPVPAGYLLDTGTWRSLYYVFIACSAALFVAGFFIFTETKFDRNTVNVLPGDNGGTTFERDTEKSPTTGHTEERTNSTLSPIPKKSYLQQLSIVPLYNRDASFWLSLVRSFTYLAYPAVLWTIAAYGIFIGTGALFISYTFPALIILPPYNWAVANSGLIGVSTIVGLAFALPIGPISDRVAAYFTRKNSHVRQPEHRLPALIPALILLPCGCLMYGLSAYYKVHWIAMFIGNGIYQGSAYMGYVITLTYTVDSYNVNVPEMLMIICACKQTISFGLGYDLLSWIAKDGMAVITAVFATILFVVTAQLFTFLGLGLKIRKATGKWGIAKVHKY